MLFKYIFYKVYQFYIKIIKEKEIPHWFAAGILALIIIANYQIIMDAYSYYFNKEAIGVYTAYNQYLVLFLAFLLIIYFSKNKRYDKIIKTCRNLSRRKKILLRFFSILYVIITIVCFFWLGYLIRTYNIS